MTRPVSSPRQMALSQTLKRNVFHKPVDAPPKNLPPAERPAEEKAPAVPEGPKATPVSASPAVGRNDPCPCGSGKKHKKCCLGKP